MNPLATDIIDSELQVRTASELRNPLLKVLLILAPWTLVVWEGTTRLGGQASLNACQLVVTVYGVTTASGVDTRAGKLHLFLRRALVLFVLLVLFLLGTRGNENAIAGVLANIAEMYQRIPLLGRIGFRTWLIIALIFAGVVATANLSTRDGLWLGRKTLAGFRFNLYMIAMVTLAVVMSSLTVRLEDCWRIGFARYHLLRNHAYGHLSWWLRARGELWAFFASLFYYVDHTADVVRSLVEDRGFFEDDYRDAHVIHWGVADSVAVVLLLVAILGILAASYCAV